MSTFPETAEVAIEATRPIPGPGHRFPNADFTLSQERKVVSGAVANAVKDALPHTLVTEDDVAFEVVGGGTSPEESLIDAVGESTAENITADTGAETLADAQALTDEELGAVKGVGDATIANKIRASEGSDESNEGGEE